MTNKEKMMTDFKAVKLIFQKVGVRFFSIKGTCLGSIRNADFIEWDTNIDQAIFATQDEIDAIRKLLFDEGFEILIQFDDLVAMRNTTVNIYRVLKDDKRFYVDNIPRIYFREGSLDTLVQASLGDQFCYTQTNPVEHLVDLYGTDWAVPKPK